MISLLRYGNTNTYLIKGKNGYVLLDTDMPGTLSSFYKEIKKFDVKVEDIKYLLISHFHLDHMGLAGQLTDLGIEAVVFAEQKDHIHDSDEILNRINISDYIPLCENKIRFISVDMSRSFLKEIGIDGEIIYTPGHSDDSISLLLDEGSVLVGDLNPLYELELHKGSQIEKSWDQVFKKAAEIFQTDSLVVYYGHAKSASVNLTTHKSGYGSQVKNSVDEKVVQKIMRLSDKGFSLDKIISRTGADPHFVSDVIRMYMTHPGVSVLGILDRIEIKGK
ncbi:MAG: MBL fold metallo-hydrolase [Lachnospiraceae bacterium]|nr:MBL fold metallo-hydrolase [Lachnospiraceae bacterium]